MSNKEDFASYLEETAAEIRAVNITRPYLEEVCGSLRDHLKIFEVDEEENCRLKLIKDKK